MTTTHPNDTPQQPTKHWYPSIAKIGKEYRNAVIEHERDTEIFRVQDLMNEVAALVDAAVAEELEACLAQVPMPTLSYEQIENRIATLRSTGNGQAGQKEEA